MIFNEKSQKSGMGWKRGKQLAWLCINTYKIHIPEPVKLVINTIYLYLFNLYKNKSIKVGMSDNIAGPIFT